MAIMYPDNIEAYKPTGSERNVYYALKTQLPDRCTVFYSIKWFTLENHQRIMSEADFLVFDPNYGFLILEVKGGLGIRVDGDRWYLQERTGERPLPQSPYDQAEKSMWYFVKYYEEQYNFRFGGIYGAAVVFPNYTVLNKELLSNRSKLLTIDYSDMTNLEECIRNLFLAWSGKRNPAVRFSEDQRKKFIKLVQKRIAISAAAGALIEHKRAQLEVINRVQDNYIYLINNYKQVYFTGGAGTGKTWIAIKLATKHALMGSKVLILCSSKPLSESISNLVSYNGITVSTFDSLMSMTLGEIFNQLAPLTFEGVADYVDEDEVSKYDVVIVDEAQDFNEEWAYVTRLFMKDQTESNLYVFYDETQNVHQRTFGDSFMINNPPFLLRENLRNTASIYKWAVENTDFGKEVIANPITGPSPDSYEEKNKVSVIKRVELLLDELINRENVQNESVVILTDNSIPESCFSDRRVASWRLVTGLPCNNDQVQISTAEDFKGLEADVIIYVRTKNTSKVLNYIAYTRARFYLYEIIYK